MAEQLEISFSTAAVDRPNCHPLNPFAWGVGVIRYLGGIMVVGCQAVGSMLHPLEAAPTRLGGTTRQVDRLVGLGFGVMAAVHVGMGSFLAMQAYFGATFVDGIGPVVGVGLIRNLAPLMAGFLEAILVSVLFVADLRHEPDGPILRRAVAVRVCGASIAGPILAAWGSLVGVVIGWLVGRSMMGVTEPMFFDLFLEMLWARDIVGLVIKGVLFGGIAALLACHEGVRTSRRGERLGGMDAISRGACRAAVLGSVAILGINALWFVFVYHAGPAFGPTLLVPPVR